MSAKNILKRYVTCHYCGARHVAEYSHESQLDQGPVYVVVCDAGPGWFEDFYTTEALICPLCVRDDDATLWAHTRGEHS
jgi:hypothetical protein